MPNYGTPVGDPDPRVYISGPGIEAKRETADSMKAVVHDLVRQTHILEHAIRQLREQQKETLVQLNGGDTDPWTCENHPGHILAKLGWEYIEPDVEDVPENTEPHHLGLHWMDPEEKGTGKRSLMCLTNALAIVYRRLEARMNQRLLSPNWMERLLDDDEPAGV